MDLGQYLTQAYGIDERLVRRAGAAEAAVRPAFAAIEETAAVNQMRVLKAFQDCRVAEGHFNWATGYGYNDAGREVTERVFAAVFGAEEALVRTQIVNGTHALSLCFTGLLRPGDEVVYCSGAPYDTLKSTFGAEADFAGKGGLDEFGVVYKQVDLLPDGGIDLPGIRATVTPNTKIAAIQRATGYEERAAITLAQIEEWAAFVHGLDADIVCMTDNCYGEFLETEEPTQRGVDLMAGSLIKNPGGGLALSGGYVAGRADLVGRIAQRLTCPGIGGECGLTFGQTRSVLQGLFLAPSVTAAALKGAVFCARFFEDLGFHVAPAWDAARSDIIETIRLGSAEALVAFCEGVQAAAPVDSFVRPEPWDMPGYADPVIMAAGAFVQGSSIELSADGPLREPYNVYFQGGLTYEYSRMGALMAAQSMLAKGLLTDL
ncbi:MAG: methionine gamma-lyase family protein [Clostridiales Family XIII bacterium]|jgi:cystathionine beta-lyase family protein involved in aluminum resistance|nr:methionine gamma-lyase family protein [Clostridiales Family XIII bacterium]